MYLSLDDKDHISSDRLGAMRSQVFWELFHLREECRRCIGPCSQHLGDSGGLGDGIWPEYIGQEDERGEVLKYIRFEREMLA